MLDADLFKNWVLIAVRYFGGPVIGWISFNFGITESETTAFVVGGIVWGVMFLWALVTRYTQSKAVEVALELPAGSSKETLKDVLASK